MINSGLTILITILVHVQHVLSNIYTCIRNSYSSSLHDNAHGRIACIDLLVERGKPCILCKHSIVVTWNITLMELATLVQGGFFNTENQKSILATLVQGGFFNTENRKSILVTLVQGGFLTNKRRKSSLATLVQGRFFVTKIQRSDLATLVQGGNLISKQLEKRLGHHGAV